jgi:hypothetical protein
VTAFAIFTAADLAKWRPVLQDCAMKFRLKAFSLHLLGSASALTLILGTLYFGWYRWPGWRLADATTVVVVLVGVDLVLGPLMTFVIASKSKARRVLTRDIGIIVAVQICALIYGSASLWSGRPLYYTFSVKILQMVQAYDIDSHEAELGRQQNADLAPHWYSTPRWIWTPLPADPEERQKIVTGAITGAADVVSMPRYFKPWEQGLPSLRAQLKKVDDVPYFSRGEKKKLKEHLQEAGFASDQMNTMPLTGRGKPLLVVFDLASLKIVGIFKVK